MYPCLLSIYKLSEIGFFNYNRRISLQFILTLKHHLFKVEIHVILTTSTILELPYNIFILIIFVFSPSGCHKMCRLCNNIVLL